MDKEEEVDTILTSLRDHGFINFYGESAENCVRTLSSRVGMQRFGTSTVPTHVTGLFLLKGQWKEAVDSILSLREGEHPDCTTGRLAWLEDGDFKKALSLMPRRSVAERSIWEYWNRGNMTSDLLGALSNVSTAFDLLTCRTKPRFHETCEQCTPTRINHTSGTSSPPNESSYLRLNH